MNGLITASALDSTPTCTGSLKLHSVWGLRARAAPTLIYWLRENGGDSKSLATKLDLQHRQQLPCKPSLELSASAVKGKQVAVGV